MAGRRGLVMGVANDHSIAWAIAAAAHKHGASLAFTHQGEAFARRVEPLAESVGSTIVMPCDVSNPESLDAVFSRIGEEWGELDFVLHAIAYSDKNELRGRYLETSRDNFLKTLDISCYSFTAVAQRAAPMMKEGGSLVTLTYSGAERVMPNYNVMGVAKAALEASVRYLAADLGPGNIRVNALSAGPMRTLAGSGVSDARVIFNFQRNHAPLRRTPTLDEVGGSALYLLSSLSGAVTGEVHFVDCGYSNMAMPSLDELKHIDANDPPQGQRNPGEAAQ
jgi:enoyl-[acyl-carrier protein] reductase I